jgi:lysophospholipase
LKSVHPHKLLLLAALACGLIVPATALAQPRDTPPLTTEAELTGGATPAAIEAFWKARGQRRDFKGQGGLRIAAMRFLQPQRGSERGAIVIVSGRTESMLKYKETVFDLWRQGYAVYIHDHRGQGLSDREPQVRADRQKGYVQRFDDYVDDLRTFIAAQVLPATHARVFLWSHSMGGAVTARFLQSGAAELQGIRAAVLSSPMLQIEGMVPHLPADILSCNIARSKVETGQETDYMFFGGPYRAEVFEKNEYTQSPVRYQRLVAQYRQVPTVQLGSATWGWIARSCDAAHAARDSADRVGMPLLLMVAGKDSIVHNGGARSFCDKLRQSRPGAGCGGPDGGPVVIEDARHEIYIERDPARQQALQAALAFFAAQ